MIVWRVDPDELWPPFRRDAEAFLAHSPFAWFVTSGYRSLAEQARLWAQGRTPELVRSAGLDPALARPGLPRVTKAQPGQSAHNYGLALDVVLDVDPDTPGLQPSWNIRLAGWAWLKAAGIPHPRLQNGWSFGDYPHLQRYRWRRFVSEAERWRASLADDGRRVA